MLKGVVKFAVVIILGLAVHRVANSADFFGIGEFYSNADGSIQFILMNTVQSGRLSGLTLVASDGSNTHKFTFPSDLPDGAVNRPFLVGTKGFADLNVVTPDFVVSNGFLFFPNGSISLNGNEFSYTGLPVDGVHAFWGNPDIDRIDFYGAWAINFAGQSYTFPAVPRANFEYGGLWWSSPAGSQSGWGLAIEHQGDTVFAMWPTYDSDGSPVWFVMPAVPYSVRPFDEGGGQHTFEGKIYRTSGPPFGMTSFDATAVNETVVGKGGFHFDAAGDSIFYFDIGGTYMGYSGSYTYKSITHQTFADPVSICAQGATPGPTPNFQGLWWNASESGWGLHLTQQGNIIFALWFTYDAAGKATWLAMAASKTAPNTYAGTIYRTTGPAYNAATFDPSAVREAEVGTGTLTFTDRSTGAFSYAVNAVVQTKSISRQIFAAPSTVCN